MFNPRPTTSLEYVKVGITASQAGEPFDPTGDNVEMAFTLNEANPVSADWNAAVWQVNTTTTPITYNACCLVGPAGTVQLAAGEWSVWVRVTDSPEVPQIPISGLLVVT